MFLRRHHVFSPLQGWVVASDSIKGQSYVVHNLRPDTSYMFLVRARNTHGISLPSQVAESFRTAGEYHDNFMTWKHFTHYWPFVQGIHRWPLVSLHKVSVMQSFHVSYVVSMKKLLNN